MFEPETVETAVAWESIDHKSWNQVVKNNTDCFVVAVDNQRDVVVVVVGKQIDIAVVELLLELTDALGLMEVADFHREMLKIIIILKKLNSYFIFHHFGIILDIPMLGLFCNSVTMYCTL